MRATSILNKKRVIHLAIIEIVLIFAAQFIAIGMKNDLRDLSVDGLCLNNCLTDSYKRLM